MRNLSVRQVLTIGCLACAGAIVLLSESSTADSASAWLRAIVREIHLTCLEPSTQWLVVLGLLIYFVFFLWLARERNRNEVWWGLGNPDLWLCGLVLAGLVNYGLVHRTGWHGMQLIGLLAGMVLALAARSWAWRTGHGPDPRLVVRRLKLIITVVVTLLVCITLWQPELGSTYKYRGEVRWSGAWRNPNTYGLLMAVALVLTIGLFAANLAVPSGRRLRRLFFFGGTGDHGGGMCVGAGQKLQPRRMGRSGSGSRLPYRPVCSRARWRCAYTVCVGKEKPGWALCDRCLRCCTRFLAVPAYRVAATAAFVFGGQHKRFFVAEPCCHVRGGIADD